MKYLIAQTYCDDEEAETPDIYVLELNPRITMILEAAAQWTKIVSATISNFKSVELDWRDGHWLVAGDDGTGLTEDKPTTVIENDDVIAIVGEDVDAVRLVVTPDGDIRFRCIHYDTKIHMRTAMINIKELGTL